MMLSPSATIAPLEGRLTFAGLQKVWNLCVSHITHQTSPMAVIDHRPTFESCWLPREDMLVALLVENKCLH